MNKNVLLLVLGIVLLVIALGIYFIIPKAAEENQIEESVTQNVVETIEEDPIEYTEVSNKTPEEYRNLIEEGVTEKVVKEKLQTLL